MLRNQSPDLKLQTKKHTKMGEAAVSISDRSTKTSTVTSKQQSAGKPELSGAELVQAGYRSRCYEA